VNEEALAHWGLSRQKQTNKQILSTNYVAIFQKVQQNAHIGSLHILLASRIYYPLHVLAIAEPLFGRKQT
jgi:hypothetical protein